MKNKIVNAIGLKVLGVLVTVLCKTLRIEKKNFFRLNEFLEKNTKCIVAFWHGTMLISWFLLKNKNFSALVSKSKDGEYLTSVLKKWGYNVIRGSSRDGGKAALNLMIETAGKDGSLAITPDGPTGPPFKLKAGSVIVAQRTGIPLFLVGISCSDSLKLKSWDSFEIPKPFSKVNCVCSDVIHVPKELNREEVSKKIIECEEVLNSLRKEAASIA